MKKIKPDGSKTLYIRGIYEVDKNSSGTVTGTKTYYPAAGAMRIGGTLYYVLKDHLGSASVLTDASGNPVAGADTRYYPFGEARSSTTPMLTDKLFTGQREITGLGIYYYGARFYSPSINRFLSADTIVPGYANPQNLNRYSYVLNNPLRYIDPTGHWVDEGCGCSYTPPPPVNYCTTHPGACGGGGGGGSGGNGGSGGGGSGGGGMNYCATHPGSCGLPSTSPDPAPDDPGPITDLILQLPGTAEDWSNVSTGFDVLAWVADLYAASAVTYAFFGGAAVPAPLVAAGLPEVPLTTGLAGMAIAELYVQPVIWTGNILASISMGAAIVSDTKAGGTRIEEGNFSIGVLNSMALTDMGWGSSEAYVSLALQSVAVANDFHWTSLPFSMLP